MKLPRWPLAIPLLSFLAFVNVVHVTDKVDHTKDQSTANKFRPINGRKTRPQCRVALLVDAISRMETDVIHFFPIGMH